MLRILVQLHLRPQLWQRRIVEALGSSVPTSGLAPARPSEEGPGWGPGSGPGAPGCSGPQSPGQGNTTVYLPPGTKYNVVLTHGNDIHGCIYARWKNTTLYHERQEGQSRGSGGGGGRYDVVSPPGTKYTVVFTQGEDMQRCIYTCDGNREHPGQGDRRREAPIAPLPRHRPGQRFQTCLLDLPDPMATSTQHREHARPASSRKTTRHQDTANKNLPPPFAKPPLPSSRV